MMENRLLKKGTWIADKKGTYAISDIEQNFVIIRDVIRLNDGKIGYGKKRVIGIKDLDNYTLV